MSAKDQDSKYRGNKLTFCGTTQSDACGMFVVAATCRHSDGGVVAYGYVVDGFISFLADLQKRGREGGRKQNRRERIKSILNILVISAWLLRP